MKLVENPSSDKDAPASEEAVYATISRICGALDVWIDRSQLVLADLPRDQVNRVPLLVAAGKHVGVAIREFELKEFGEAWDLVSEGFPVVLVAEEDNYVVERRTGSKVQLSRISNATGAISTEMLSRRGLRSTIARIAPTRTFVAKEELECSQLSRFESSLNHDPGHGDDDHGHDHPSPLRRFWGLLKLERRDVLTVFLFATVSGILSLATPLAVESLVNVVSWGTYWQPLFVLAIMLLACLGLSGVLRVIQTCLVEIIQRRQLVRIIGDLSHRFPRANRQAIEAEHPRELANRLFDIMTIQKATAVLLLDGVALVLATTLGMLLLSFYHPFLLGYVLIMLFLMISLTWVLGRGGIRTAIEESRTKYSIVHWLQDVLDSPTAFKVNGGESLAIDRTNRLVSEYLRARESQFSVVIRQVSFAIGMQVIASTTLLGLGGWLVIQGQLTLGQLVASELVVTVIVGSFAKAGKSFEKFYDLMAGVVKVGHLLDVPVDPRRELEESPDRQGDVAWDDLEIDCPAGLVCVPSVRIPSGSRVAIVGNDRYANSILLRTLAGLVRPTKGMAEIAGADARQAGLCTSGRIVGYAGPLEIFHGSLLENVSLGRLGVGRNRVRETLQSLGLWNEVLRLPDGAGTVLQTGGYPLTPLQLVILVIARAIAASPVVVLIDGLLDDLPDDMLDQVWGAISGPDAPWTLLVATNSDRITQRVNDSITVRTS